MPSLDGVDLLVNLRLPHVLVEPFRALGKLAAQGGDARVALHLQVFDPLLLRQDIRVEQVEIGHLIGLFLLHRQRLGRGSGLGRIGLRVIHLDGPVGSSAGTLTGFVREGRGSALLALVDPHRGVLRCQ